MFAFTIVDILIFILRNLQARLASAFLADQQQICFLDILELGFDYSVVKVIMILL